VNNLFSESQLLFPNQLSCLGDFLAQLGESTLFTLNVKDIKSDSYLMSNQTCDEMWGLPNKSGSGGGLVGMSTREVLARVPNFKNLEAELAESARLESKVIATIYKGERIQTALTWGGVVRVRKLLVIPVIGSQKGPIALATISQDLTRTLNPLDLFNLYRKYYPKKAKAAKQLSYYLELSKYFDGSLNNGELSVLLAVMQAVQRKQMPSLLKLAPATINNYLSSLRDKVKANIALCDVIQSLHKQKQWTLKQESF
jgi:hypothetical protein